MKNAKKLGYIVEWNATAINVVFFGLKYWVGMVSGSVAMLADAWHTLSDALTSLVVIFGYWISDQPADKEHPFGHGRAESISAIIISTLLFVVGFNFLQESIRKLLYFQSASFNYLAICVFFVSVFVKEALALWSFWAGKKINSYSLIADGWHSRSDAIASGLIVVGALFGRYVWWIDGVMGIGVSLLIIYAAYEIIKQGSSLLLGEKLDEKLEKEIRELVYSVAPEASNLHHIHLHRYGDHLESTMHINLSPNMVLKEAHAVASKIEQTLRHKLKIEATVHIEPLKRCDLPCQS